MRIARFECEKAFSAKEFQDIASRTTIDVFLAKLATEGKIRRCPGCYRRSSEDILMLFEPGRYPMPLPQRLLYIEPLRGRMRVRFGGTWIADTILSCFH